MELWRRSPVETAVHPTHTYAITGTFTVVLTATNNVGSDAASAQVVIEDSLSSLLIYAYRGKATATFTVISSAIDSRKYLEKPLRL